MVGAVTSVGSQSDSCDSALSESIFGFVKTEVIRKKGPWKSLNDVEHATREWIDWLNRRRLLEPIGCISPADLE